MMNSRLLVTVCACLFGTFSNICHSYPVTINITANISSVDDISGVLGGAINVGDTLTGSYRYELTTPDSNPLSTVGDYQHSSSPYGITLTSGGLTFRTDPNNVNFLVEFVNDHGNPPSDALVIRSYNNLPLSGGLIVDHISWQLDDPSASAIMTDALPPLPPNLSAWQSNFGLTIQGGSAMGWYFIRAHVTSVELIRGDVNGDGELNAADLLLLQRLILGL